MSGQRSPRVRVVLGVVVILAAWAAGGRVALADPPIGSTLADFYGPGTQPGQVTAMMVEARDCSLCHGDYNEAQEPYRRWAASPMGQAGRDPLFWAAVAISEQLAPAVGNLCIRCHAPRGWVNGRGVPTDGSGLEGPDFEGVSCSVCHRMADPVFVRGRSPDVDEQVLAEVAELPNPAHSAQYIIDPADRRRGPLKLDGDFGRHEWARSPFHRDARMCGTCHDVSNPLFTRRGDGTYGLNELGRPHPTGRPYDQFPLERTFSEWRTGAFGQGPVDMGGRYGGNRGLAVSSCQDCHIPTVSGYAAGPVVDPPFRDNVPQHDFRGAQTWLLPSVRNLFTDAETGLSEDAVNLAIARNQDMLRLASDMDLSAGPGTLTVRVINQTGHKLPTGLPIGRRAWVNVRFFDAAGALIAERGRYDGAGAWLYGSDTKVYQAQVGIDAEMAARLGMSPGPAPLIPLNNKVFFDSRIPPRGFTNAGFAAVQAAPVGYPYQDGQYWDDTRFIVPARAVRADARVYYQTISREVVEVLRDANTTNDAGRVFYEQWAATGKSAPVEMDFASVTGLTPCPAEFNGDGAVDVRDFLAFLAGYAAGDPGADLNRDGTLNVQDFLAFLAAYGAGCA